MAPKYGTVLDLLRATVDEQALLRALFLDEAADELYKDMHDHREDKRIDAVRARRSPGARGVRPPRRRDE